MDPGKFESFDPASGTVKREMLRSKTVSPRCAREPPLRRRADDDDEGEVQALRLGHRAAGRECVRDGR